jgi:magnesium transporter
MITMYRWDCTAQACARVESDRLPPSAAEIAPDDVYWVDLTDPTPEEEQAVFDQFLPVHTLTLGDMTKPRREPDQGAHFPKVEEFPDYLLVIVNPLPPDLAAAVTKKPNVGKKAEPAPALPHVRASRLIRRHRPQLSAVLTRNVLITHHHQPLACVDEVRAFVDRHGNTARRGPDYLFHLILDAQVDEYAPVVERVASQLDRLEARLFKDPSPRVLSRILRLKRLVVGLRKTLILEREVLARLVRGEFDLVDEREIVYYRNVYDHLVRYTELIEAAREMVSDLMQTHLSAASNRLNQIMKTLTMISTVVLPMTLIAGIYGMNFEDSVWPDFHSPWGFWFAMGVMGLTGLLAFTLFRWRRWI